jgi:hypothetical protein
MTKINYTSVIKKFSGFLNNVVINLMNILNIVNNEPIIDIILLINSVNGFNGFLKKLIALLQNPFSSTSGNGANGN